MSLSLDLAERGLLPDFLVRSGIRRLLARRLASEDAGDPERQEEKLQRLLDLMRRGPIAVATDEANEQHYEVPAEFFQAVLGARLKYSSGFWPAGNSDLDEAEFTMLELTLERARIKDGMSVLELGCGWGSLTLFLAERRPQSRIVAVSNSASQRQFIMDRATERGLCNVEVRTCDMREFDPGEETFDRVVSVEMFEHMRNYRELLSRIDRWLAPDGRLFVHVFSHERIPYLFEVEGEDDWMAKNFFTGGLMPSHELLGLFQDDLVLESRWRVDGRHYQKTSEAWVANLDRNHAAVKEIFADVYGPAEAARWIGRWRLFFLACAELFGYRGGAEWGVSHYLFRTRRATTGGSS